MKFVDFFYQIVENAAKRSYACLMLDCSDFKNELKKIQDQIDKEDIYTEKEGHGLENDPHITALYGIHEQDPKVVKEALDLSAITYKLTGLSLFENDEFDVLKCSVVSPDLKKLNKQCRKELEYTNSYDDFVPHLTVGYLKPGTGRKYTYLKFDTLGEEMTSSKFIFSTKDSKKTTWNV